MQSLFKGGDLSKKYYIVDALDEIPTDLLDKIYQLVFFSQAGVE